MPTFGDVSSVEEREQAQIDSASVGYEAYLQSLDPAARAEQERRDREAVEEADAGTLDARSEEMLNMFATPEARDEAERLDVDLGDLRGKGSGDRGRIVVQDVRDHAEDEEGGGS